MTDETGSDTANSTSDSISAQQTRDHTNVLVYPISQLPAEDQLTFTAPDGAVMHAEEQEDCYSDEDPDLQRSIDERFKYRQQVWEALEDRHGTKDGSKLIQALLSKSEASQTEQEDSCKSVPKPLNTYEVRLSQLVTGMSETLGYAPESSVALRIAIACGSLKEHKEFLESVRRVD